MIKTAVLALTVALLAGTANAATMSNSDQNAYKNACKAQNASPYLTSSKVDAYCTCALNKIKIELGKLPSGSPAAVDPLPHATLTAIYTDQCSDSLR